MNTLAPAAASEGPLAIICGGGILPFVVADIARRSREVVLFPLHGAADVQQVAKYRHHWLHLGQVGRFYRLARQEGCRDVVLIGTLIRPSLWQLRPDFHTLLLLPRIVHFFRGGDDHLLTRVAGLLAEHGFHLLGAHEVAPEILMPEGDFGSRGPTAADRDDIAYGLEFLHAAGTFDVGQAVVVAGRHILAVEAAEGTDQMLARVAQLRANGRIRSQGGVLVKAPKPGQDRRVDLPTVGPDTVEGAARAGLSGIAVVAGATIAAQAERMRQLADQNKMFVMGMADGGNLR